MRYLLDTRTFLWSAAEPERLSPRVRDILEDPESEALVSHASVWEIAIKVGAGRLRVEGQLADFLPRQLLNHRFTDLASDMRHILAVASLPRLHGDPFDRLIVCQGQIENLPILSGDPALAQYSVPVIW